MKKIHLIIGGLIVVGIAAVTAPFAMAQSQNEALTDEQRSRIVENCTSIKNTLVQLKASDALLRVNRGQAYESLSSRLMDTFNSRLSGNGLDSKGMSSVTTEYTKTLNAFRTAYQAYERQLTTAIRIDCAKDPSGFHAAVQDARTKRNAVHTQVLALHQRIDDYGVVVNDFYQDYKRVSEAL